ncbi:MAG: type II toxin-antitoxin system VapC family toxin [Longimicrobiaceae bacterium]
MPLYLDACAFAKRYLNEGVSTSRMREITGRFNRWGGFVVSSFVEPEVISAIAKYARNTEHPILRAHYLAKHSSVVEVFRRDLSKAAFTIVYLSDELVEDAANLLKSHPEYEIGAADAVHLVTALEIRPKVAPPLVFVTADNGLERAAKAEGLITLNPLRDGVDALERIVSQL